MTKVNLTETVLLDADAGVRFTNDGYLVAQPRVGRTGIQVYRGSEVGKPDKQTVRVYRPEAEVFHEDALKSIAHKPITFNHPSVMVDASNWKDLAVGAVGDSVVRDGEFIRVPMTLMDAQTIQKVKDGDKEMSLGYTAELVDEAGTTPTGEAYDMKQTNIRVNHLAVCRQARGGPQLRIGDTGDETMKTIIVDGIKLEVPETAAAVIERTEQRHADELKRVNDSLSGVKANAADLTAKLADANKAHETAKGQIAVLEKQVKDAEITPAKLDELVKARSGVIERARATVGDALVVDGRTDMDIRRQAVTKHLGDAAVVATLSDEAVTGAFLALPKAAGTQNNTLADNLSGRPHYGVRDAAADPATKAWNDRGAKMANAWKTPGAAA